MQRHGRSVIKCMAPICCTFLADEDGQEPADDGDVPDPMAGMNARQRKMYELKQKLRVGQKANQHAVIAERKREKVREQQAARGSRL